jgi:hypothetical protein
MSDPGTVSAALFIFLVCTCASLALTFFWATGNRRPVPVRASLTGRPAAPYWYSRSGLADERGITARMSARS